MGTSLVISKFDKFWEDELRELGYPLKAMVLDMPTLREQRAIPSDIEASRVLRLYVDDFVEVALVEFDSDADLRRSLCTRTAQSWKENRLIKPLLIFTNGADSFAVIVPGKGVGGEAKVLGLSDRLYRTDLDVLESIRFPGKAEDLSRSYDIVFFPYQKVRDEFFKGYRELYERVEKAVEKELKGESTSYAQRFLGRLMFLHAWKSLLESEFQETMIRDLQARGINVVNLHGGTFDLIVEGNRHACMMSENLISG